MNRHHEYSPTWWNQNNICCTYCGRVNGECKGKNSNENYSPNLFQDAGGLFWGLRDWLCDFILFGGVLGVYVGIMSLFWFLIGGSLESLPVFLIITSIFPICGFLVASVINHNKYNFI